MYITYERTDGGGDDKHGLVKKPPPWSARLLSSTSVSYLRAAPRAGRGCSTPTSRIRLRPSVLDRHPVPLRGVEASNRSRVHASSPIPLYHRYLDPVLGIVGDPCSSPSSRSKGSTRTVHTPPPVWGCLCYSMEDDGRRTKSVSDADVAIAVSTQLYNRGMQVWRSNSALSIMIRAHAS